MERVSGIGGVFLRARDQQALFRGTEGLARIRGLGATIDGWEPDVAWLRG